MSVPNYPPPNIDATPPSNNLVWAILTTLLCCLPFGIVAIVFATKVDPLWMTGQHAQARDAADKARKWSIAGATIGAVVALAYAALGIITALSETTTIGT